MLLFPTAEDDLNYCYHHWINSSKSSPNAFIEEKIVCLHLSLFKIAPGMPWIAFERANSASIRQCNKSRWMGNKETTRTSSCKWVPMALFTQSYNSYSWCHKSQNGTVNDDCVIIELFKQQFPLMFVPINIPNMFEFLLITFVARISSNNCILTFVCSTGSWDYRIDSWDVDHFVASFFGLHFILTMHTITNTSTLLEISPINPNHLLI